MVWLYIIGGLLLLELLILFLRVGVDATLTEETQVKLRIGPFRMKLPEKGKEKNSGAEKEAAKKKPAKKKTAKAKPKIGFSEVKNGVETLLPPLKTALRKTRRSVRIHPMNLHVIFGGYDPASVATHYGWAQAMMWSWMPELERLLVIPDPHIRLDTDFNADHTVCRGEFGLSIRIGNLLNILMTLLIPAAKWYKNLPKPVTPEPPAAEQPQTEKPAEPVAVETETTTDKPLDTAKTNTEQKGESYGNDEARSQ